MNRRLFYANQSRVRMAHATLSVITPNYNHAAYLRQAIEAVVSQSRTPDEYIILDDASTDNSLEIIDSYAVRYPFIRVIRQPKNLGVVAAIEALVSEAKGDYIYPGAADDYILPGFFEQAMGMAKEYPEAGIIFGKMVAVDAAGRKIRDVQAPSWPTRRFVSPAEYLNEYIDRQPAYRSLTAATVYKTSCLAEVGGFRHELGHWCDSFAARAMALKVGAAYVPQTFMAWRKLPDSLSHSTQRHLQKNLAIVARAAELMRSEHFRDRFPEKHVRRWLRGYRRAIVLMYLRGLGKSASHRLRASFSRGRKAA
jgi:glycosyltransferase involved in cell wall biosynthesis